MHCKKNLLFLAQNKRSFWGQRAVMYRIHLVLHISTFFPFLFPRLNGGYVQECVSFGLPLPRRGNNGLQDAPQMRDFILLWNTMRQASVCWTCFKKRTKDRRLIVANLLENSCFFSFHPQSANLCTILLNSEYICAVSLWIVLLCLLCMLYNVLGGGGGGGCRGKGCLLLCLPCCHCDCGPDTQH